MTQTLADVIECEWNAFIQREGDIHLWFYVSERMRAWAEHGADPPALLDYLFCSVAQLFLHRTLDYAQGDGLANMLFQAAQDRFWDEIFENGPLADDDLWWRTYLAFDDGEFSRGDGLDPVVIYTHPQIALIVADVQAKGGLTALLAAATKGAISAPAATSGADAAPPLPPRPPQRRVPYRGRPGPGRGWPSRYPKP